MLPYWLRLVPGEIQRLSRTIKASRVDSQRAKSQSIDGNAAVHPCHSRRFGRENGHVTPSIPLDPMRGNSCGLEHGVVDIDKAEVMVDLMRHAKLNDYRGIDRIPESLKERIQQVWRELGGTPLR